MRNISKLSISNLGLRRRTGQDDFNALLNLLPEAIFIIDSQTNRVKFANTKAIELTGYQIFELLELNVSDLIPGWQTQDAGQEPTGKPLNPDEDASAYQQKDLILSSGETLAIRTSNAYLPNKENLYLLLIEKEDPKIRQQTELLRITRFWEALHKLAEAPQQTNFESAINLSLEVGQALTGAEILAVYYAGDKGPALERWAGWGETQRLPNRLPPQDLTHLRAPCIWQCDERTISGLHRTARAAGFSYMASAPLGQATAAIGLLVVADSKKQPEDYSLSLVQNLAATITTIIQNYVQRSSLQEELQEKDLAIAISDALEGAIQEGVVVLSPDLRILKLNSSSEEMLGYESEAVQGHLVEKILIGTENLVPALKEAQQGNSDYDLGNMRLYRRNGQAFLAHLRTLPVIKSDDLKGIIILVQDLSEQEEIREHTQQLEQRALLGEVTAVFAHEVRNPINNISTGLQLMALNLPQDDPNQESITRLQQDCDRLEELMKSVLAFSRPTDYEMETLDLEIVLRRLLERLHPRMVRVNVQYNLQVEPNCPPIEGNLRALEQVFNNLINNAVQAMSDEGGHLAIKIQSVNTSNKRVAVPHERWLSPERLSYIEVSVADTGPGIPRELQERIFQPFFTTNKNGSGLGLAISKRIITAHKGNIYLTSFPGGTVFHVQIPTSDKTLSDEKRLS
jgi:two-component system, NtrC family, sensor histidine kinase AtoS